MCQAKSRLGFRKDVSVGAIYSAGLREDETQLVGQHERALIPEN